MKRSVGLLFLVSLAGCQSSPILDSLPSRPLFNGVGVWLPWWSWALGAIVLGMIVLLIAAIAFWRMKAYYARAILATLSMLTVIQGWQIAEELAARVERTETGWELKGDASGVVEGLDYVLIPLFAVGIVGLVVLGLRHSGSNGQGTVKDAIRYVEKGELSHGEVLDYLIADTSPKFGQRDVRRMIDTGKSHHDADYSTFGWLLHLFVWDASVRKRLETCLTEIRGRIVRIVQSHPVTAQHLVHQLGQFLGKPDRESVLRQLQKRLSEAG